MGRQMFRNHLSRKHHQLGSFQKAIKKHTRFLHDQKKIINCSVKDKYASCKKGN